MKYVEYTPAKPLDAFINCFWSIEPDTGSRVPGAWDRSVPDGSLEFVLHLAEPMLRQSLAGAVERESRGVLIGQTTRPYLVAPAGRTRLLGVRFFPHTGYLFVDGPVAGFNDQSVDLDSIFPPRARVPVERIGNAGTIDAAIRILEGWCRERLRARAPGAGDHYFAWACRRILRDRGSLSTAELSRSAGISGRHLERLFQARSGISPKLFACIIRFQHALGYLDTSHGLAAVAQESGHFDQPHFIREFRRFAGITPREYVREHHPWTRHFADPANRSYLYNSR